jgi:hypothetical protein
MGDAVPQTPWDLSLLFSRMDAFALLETVPAVQSICLLGGQGSPGMEPERRCKSGMDGGLTAASSISSPLLYLRMAVFLSKQPGPPHVGDFVYHRHILNHEDQGVMAIIRVLRSTKP